MYICTYITGRLGASERSNTLATSDGSYTHANAHIGADIHTRTYTHTCSNSKTIYFRFVFAA